LPETPGGNRNYDYRYAWIRDATFALWAMYSLGLEWEAVDFFEFIADMASGDQDLQIMYGIRGERELEEYELDHLPGYANSRPVRIGNAAYSQRQHDVWGALLDSVYLHSRAADHLDNRIWPILDKQVGEALKHWREPDAGIWEVRGEPKHFTSSKIMCWVAVDRGARLARMNGDDGKAAEWELAADEIKQDILDHGLDARGVFTQYYGGTSLDASLLLAPLLRFLPADDPRIRATVMAIRDELTVDGLVLRYRVEETDDGFAGEEGTFTICSFWMVSALCEIGEQAALVRRTAGALRRGDRPPQRTPSRQLPAGLHPSGPDQRRAPRDRARAGRRRRRHSHVGRTAYTDAAATPYDVQTAVRRRGETRWPAPRGPTTPRAFARPCRRSPPARRCATAWSASCAVAPERSSSSGTTAPSSRSAPAGSPSTSPSPPPGCASWRRWTARSSSTAT
jgi:hypothetical protein